VRQWFTDSRLTFDDLRQARKGLLDSTDGLAAMPLHHRLWHGHLYWLSSLPKSKSSPASGECFDPVSGLTARPQTGFSAVIATADTGKPARKKLRNAKKKLARSKRRCTSTKKNVSNAASGTRRVPIQGSLAQNPTPSNKTASQRRSKSPRPLPAAFFLAEGTWRSAPAKSQHPTIFCETQ